MSVPRRHRPELDRAAGEELVELHGRDGLEGAGTAHSRVMAAIQRASSGRGSPLDWELMQLHQGGRLSTMGFYEGGNAITNPFG